MFRRLFAGLAGVLVVTSLSAVIPASAVPAPPVQPAAAAAQVLTWTADSDITRYKSTPATAVAGATTIVFENSIATGNTSGMSHTLTFDQETPGYNHDVSVNLLANPFDEKDGKWTLDVVLTPGKYRFFCALPGHSGMVGELTVTQGGPDTTPPTVDATITGTRDPQGNYVGSATIAVTAADAGSGVDFIEYQIDDLSYERYSAPVQVTEVGDHSVQYRATDKAGNVSQVGSKQFSIVEPQGDTTPPTVNASVAGNNTAKATVTVTASDTGSGVKSTEYKLDSGAWTAYTAPVEVTTAGAHTLFYRATDNANNVSPEGSVQFTVTAPGDTTPPTVNATVAGNNTSKATVTITASDAGSGVKSIEYQLDGGAWTAYTAPVEVTAAGSHMLHYRATDNANNVSPEGMVSFTVTAPADTTPPTVNATVAGNNTAKATVTVTASDAGSGVKSIEYQLDGGAWTAYTAPVEVTAAGSHMLHYRATDNANNVSPEGMVSFTVTAPADTTPPTVNGTVAGDKDSQGNFYPPATVTITATDSGSGVKTREYKLDNGAWTAYTTPVAVNTLGQHTVAYRATDNANNVSPEGTVSFTIVERPVQDTTPPTVNGSVAGDRDPSGNYVGTATVTVTASDSQSGVKSREYKLDSGAWTAYTVPVVVNAVGAHTVTYRATDNANNVSPEGSTSFTIVAPPADTTAPNTSALVSGAKDPQGNYLGSATVTVTATDSGSGVKTVEYAVDNGAWTAYTAAVRVSTLGAHTVKYRATDNAGNTAAEKSVTFTVVEQGSDACPEGDNRGTVIIERDDTKVANRDTGNGCTVSDLIDQYGDYSGHGEFVRHVELVTDDLVTRGLLTVREAGTIVRAAARSDIGY